MSETKQNPAKYLEASKKESSNVLNKILVDTPYSQKDLEFEFEMPYSEIEKLLKQFATYTINEEGEIIITAREIIKSKRRLNFNEISELVTLFYNRRGKYQPIDLNSIKDDEELKEKIEAGIKMGIFQKIGNGVYLNPHTEKIYKRGN